MKTSRRNFYLSPFAFAFLFASLLSVLGGKCVGQQFKTIYPGVEHARVDHNIGNDPVKINLLRLDLRKVRLDVHHAFDKAIGVEPTSAIAARHKAVAAINAGFFRLDNSAFAGDAAGIFAVDGKILSESHNDRVSMLIRNFDLKTDVTFIHFRTDVVLYLGNVGKTLSGINRQRGQGEVIAYTPPFGDTTLSDDLGTEIVFSECTVRCKVQIREKAGNSVIPKDGFVVSLGADRVPAENKLMDFLKVQISQSGGSARVILRPELRLPGGGGMGISPFDDITNGVPQLIKNGKIDITWQQEKASKSFVEMRHPRTAAAKLKGGKFLMITVDGRQPGASVGMTLQELAEYLLSLGATAAMNLDGGGSTTMVLDGKVINTPSDRGGERKVSDAIVVTLRKNARRR